MAKRRTIEEYAEYSSGKILESIGFVEVIDELVEGDLKISPIISLLDKNLRSAFKSIEKTRRMISVSH